MGYFLVRYDSRVVIYNRRMFTRLATGILTFTDYSQPSTELTTHYAVTLAIL